MKKEVERFLSREDEVRLARMMEQGTPEEAERYSLHGLEPETREAVGQGAAGEAPRD